jgi:hypothetical protein
MDIALFCTVGSDPIPSIHHKTHSSLPSAGYPNLPPSIHFFPLLRVLYQPFSFANSPSFLKIVISFLEPTCFQISNTGHLNLLPFVIISDHLKVFDLYKMSLIVLCYTRAFPNASKRGNVTKRDSFVMKQLKCSKAGRSRVKPSQVFP